jgi:hypothetical protein
MKSNGLEYRIFKNGTGDSFKVEVKSRSFMGIERWTPLYEHYFYDGAINVREYNDQYKKCLSFVCAVCTVAEFKTCAAAKKEAITFSKAALRNVWSECKC